MGLYAGNIFGGACSAYGNLCQLTGIRIGDYGTVGENHQPVCAVRRIIGQKHDECARNGVDARLCLYHLECCA